MGAKNAIFILQIIFVYYCNARQLNAEASPFLAGKDTPVWFLESNPQNSENPILSKIPNALEKIGLIEDNNLVDESSDTSTGKKENVLYLEILVAVDYSLYKKLGENVDDALKYIISFWTSSDLRFRPLSSPKIYINIAGIVIAKDPNALYYIEQNKNDKGHVNANKILFEQGKYFKNKRDTANHDILVTLTGENICTVDKVSNNCDPYTIGASLTGKACHSHLSTAIIEDNGAFDGVLIATHEIGHLLGIPHDGVGSAAYCMTHESYIMATSIYENNENNFKWSYCSKEAFNKLPSKPISECLRNKPNPGSPVKFILPGQILSASQQCERTGNSIACFNSFNPCNKLLCFNEKEANCKNVGITAEGTICGENKYCLAGNCVPEK